MDKLSISKSYLLKCNYGIDDASVFEFHLFSLLVTVPIAYLLLYNASLRKFYAPLARIVNISIFLYFFTSFLFFWYWNNAATDDEGNCAEIFFSRLTTICIMFGELHQIYLIAYSLGLGNIRVKVSSTLSYSLEQVLTYASFTAVGTILFAFFFFRDILFIVEHAWTIYVSLAQLYIIKAARSSRDDLREFTAVSVNDSSVLIFEHMSVMQLLLAGMCLLYRIGTEVMGSKLMGRIELTLILLDQVCVTLFYLKTLLIKERTNVTMTVV